MIKQKKWTLLTFHASIIVILLGAGITRYFGYEGMMHIREGNSSNTFLSRESYVKFHVEKGGQVYDFQEPVLFASLGNNNWSSSYLLGEDLVEVEVLEFIPNPKPVLYESMDGKPILQLVVAGNRGREEYFLEQGEVKRIRNLVYNFGDTPMPNAVNIAYRDEKLMIQPSMTLHQTIMATQQKDTLFAGKGYYPLRMRSLYSDGLNNFVFSDFREKGKAKIDSEDPKVKNESISAFENGSKNQW